MKLRRSAIAPTPIGACPADKQARRSVFGVALLAAFEAALCLIPVPPPIGRQTVREHLAKLDQFRHDLADAAHGLVDTNRLGLAGDGDQIELASLNDMLGHSIGLS